MDNRAEVREFLVSRRARITPEQAGVETFGDRRRVTGLRREEVARLAGVSVDYFTRLERGNLGGVSDEVLDAIARALQLDDAEREHLFDLARASQASPRAQRRPLATEVRPEVRYLLDAITEAPAIVLNHRMDLVAGNELGHALHSPMYAGAERPVNISRFIFLDPRAKDFFSDWQRSADTNVAILRGEAGRNPHDAGLASLIGELSMRSEEFRTLWAAHDVRRHYAGMKRFVHPVVGELELHYLSVPLHGDRGMTLTTYPAVPGSASADALRLLASWAASEGVLARADPTAATKRRGAVAKG
ncbi:helix-turn-helix transcriptional regulator [Agrococcus terreus]|uniref:Transcriptional regulator n=1 Tax=Agrococcus terreus TaxID=574649 RepID=A0ABQ2KN16_9MICO|nr:helix-turn-helix transcriptional regulator [Agrococcus terreus]GGN84791.1 transcriptional regulator [Agrococcus terreus]